MSFLNQSHQSLPYPYYYHYLFVSYLNYSCRLTFWISFFFHHPATDCFLLLASRFIPLDSCSLSSIISFTLLSCCKTISSELCSLWSPSSFWRVCEFLHFVLSFIQPHKALRIFYTHLLGLGYFLKDQ